MLDLSDLGGGPSRIGTTKLTRGLEKEREEEEEKRKTGFKYKTTGGKSARVSASLRTLIRTQTFLIGDLPDTYILQCGCLSLMAPLMLCSGNKFACAKRDRVHDVR